MPHCVPLHVHSHFSLLEGVDAPEALLARAAACGYSALALTDSNNLYGAVAFTEAGRHHGVRPILGACLRHGRQRCTVLIADAVGYASLCRVLSRLHLGTPPSLFELLAGNAEGLHALVDDPAEPLLEAFGGRLWLEVVRPARSASRERALLEWGLRRGIPPVASTAAHFATADGHEIFRLLTAVRQRMLLDALPARLPIAPAHHLADAEQMHQRFRDLPEALVNSGLLAEQCRSDVLPRGVVLPPVPAGIEPDTYLRGLCADALRRRRWEDESAAQQRLEQELTVIRRRGLAGYFLVVREIATEARRRGYPIALRGSAGNSLICYLLRITDVDPLRFNLPLERFLHAGRPDLPDIDLDFDWKIRDEIIAWVFARYGPEHAAMVSSHLSLQPRSALREAGKVHGLSNEQISRLETVETAAGHRLETVETGVDHRLETVETGAGLCDRLPPRFPLEPERWPRIVAAARTLLGRPHHLSIHPGGVVLTPRPLENYVPLQRAAKGTIITQFEKDAIEAIGLVKIDLLGNRGLSTLAECRQLVSPLPRYSGGEGSGVRGISPLQGQPPHPQPLSPEYGGEGRPMCTDAPDPRTLSLLQRGDTLGVNQLESPAMRHLLIQVRPEGLDDVIRVLALIRPGAASIGAKEAFVRRRRGLEPVRYAHPCLEPVLRETHGLMLYDDDALRVLQTLTGWPSSEADRVRKQIAKVKTDAEAMALTTTFLTACVRNGIPRQAAVAVWPELAKFNRYSFCKSHATSYGLIAWEAAYFKAHYPQVFWTAALNNNQGMYPRWVYVEAIKRAGIEVRLPCVNRSAGPFALEGQAIRAGLDTIAHLDAEFRAAILAERRLGPYCDLADFRRRLAPGPEALALLIRCGALDFTEQTRPALFLEADLEGLVGATGELFGLVPDWRPNDYSERRRRLEEWQLLGWVAGPSLLELFSPLPRTRGRGVGGEGVVLATANSPSPQPLSPGVPGERGLEDRVTSRELHRHLGRRVRVVGLLATGRTAETAFGRTVQFFTLDDGQGLVDVSLYSGNYSSAGTGPCQVIGTAEEWYGVVTVRAERLEPLALP